MFRIQNLDICHGQEHADRSSSAFTEVHFSVRERLNGLLALLGTSLVTDESEEEAVDVMNSLLHT
jgi:hypothetical protein